MPVPAATRERIMADIHERIFENTPDALLLVDAEGRVVAANARCETVFGCPRAEFVGRPIESLMPARIADRHAAHRALYGRQPWPRPMGTGQRLLARRRDGSEFPVEVMLGPLAEDDRLHVLCVVRDMSERENAEAKSRRLAAIVDSATDAIVGKDLCGHVTTWNRAAEQLFGHRAADIVGRHIALLVPPALRAQEEGILLRLAHGEAIEPFETQRLRKDGSPVDVRLTVSPIRDAEGRVIGASKFARDITEHRRVERALRESEERFRTLVDYATDGIFIADAGGRYLDVNPAGARMLGRTREQLLGLAVADVVAPDEAGRIGPEFARLQAGERVTSTWRFRRGDGSAFWGEVHVQRLPDARVLATLRDVTDREQYERDLQRYQQELRDLARQLMEQEKRTTRRLAQVLHDQLGQTLGAMRIDFVREAVPADPRQAARHARVDRLIDEAVNEVRQVLAELRPTLLDERGLLAALDNDLRARRLGAPQLLVQLQAPPALEACRWPADVEYAAFMVAREAVANALRHARASWVRVALAGGAGMLQLEITDDGAGIPEAALHPRPGHLGVVGMRERSIAIGARFELGRRAEGGTRVALSWQAAR